MAADDVDRAGRSASLSPILVRRRLLRILLAASAVVIVLAIALAVLVPVTSGRARQAVIAELSARLDSTVELDSLDVRVLPTLRAEGAGLRVHHQGRRDVPPLVSIRRFKATGSLLGLLRGHVRQVTVEGLDIEIPPRGGDRVDGPAQHPEGVRRRQPEGSRDGSRRPFAIEDVIIDELMSTDAKLAILQRDPNRPAKVWSIHRLLLTSVGQQSMPFEAVLTNAVPPGKIETQGNFGPWDWEDPGRTPLDGTFVFEQADLQVFKGISGILAARGRFGGALERIDVEGETETPDFTVAISGQPVPLHTRFQSTVDGTNGDTILNRIDARLLDTSLEVTGRVVGTPGVKGRTVQLDVTIDKGRIEDVLRLAVSTPRPMVGALRLRTSLVIPPGDRDVVDKLRLDGRFTLEGARFTNADVSRKLAGLSRRSQGRLGEPAGGDVASDFAGTFRLADGRLTIPGVSFEVPGAVVRLAGGYDLRREDLLFHGTLFTEAKVSQMTGGIRGFLLKIVDPLFSAAGGGSAIPIKISGTRRAPSFGLDAGRVFSRGDARGRGATGWQPPSRGAPVPRNALAVRPAGLRCRLPPCPARVTPGSTSARLCLRQPAAR